MLGVCNLYLCLLSISFTINGELVDAAEVRIGSSYGGSNRTATLGSSFDFSWNYTGDLITAEWGTKDKELEALDVTLFTLDVNGHVARNVSQYTGRCFGNWSQPSPGQVKFTLDPIKVVDNQVFIFKFVSRDPFAPEVFDVVQLIVKGPPVVEIIPPVLSVLRGATANFTCYAEGFPLPKIVWVKENGLGESEIFPNNVQRISRNGSSQLIVQYTSTANLGYYICKASNYASSTARAFLGVVSLYENHDLCPPSFDANIGEPVRMCSPFQGFPPPQVSWKLPNGSQLDTGSTILHVTVNTKNDFGRYRCVARSLEKNFPEANITIRERILESSKNDTKIILTDGVKFAWEKVQGASDYILRLPETDVLKENSLLGYGNSTSVEIPYSSLSFKRDTKKRPVTITIEVLAFGNSKMIGRGTRYTNVEIRAGATTSTVSLMTLLLSFVIYNLR